MYFQKLENLSQQESYKTFNSIIDQLDSWLAFLPNSQKNKILPEYFSNKEDVPLTVMYRIFDELILNNMLKERYILRCPGIGCSHVLCFAEDLEEVEQCLYEHNINDMECDFCEEINKLTIDNIFVIYELIDVPRDKSLKKNFPHEHNVLGTSGRTLRERLIENPEMYEKDSVDKLLEYVFSDL